MLQAAFLAETDGTDIPASIAFDAFLKLIHPPGQAVLGIMLCHKILWAVIIVDPVGFFIFTRGFRREIETVPVGCQ
jgi:hypothetical protein